MSLKEVSFVGESCVCLECGKQGREWVTEDQTVQDLVTTAGFNGKITECGLYFDSIGVKGITKRRLSCGDESVCFTDIYFSVCSIV